MGFYKVDLDQPCGWPVCPKKATKEVRASGTMVYGRYCAKHAEMRVKELEKAWAGKVPR